jgi:hypothetical protein
VQEKLIPLCRLYENTSNTTGRRYFVGNLSFTSKLLLFQNDEAKDGEPGWTLFLAEREQKPQQARPVGNEKPGTLIIHPTGRNREFASWLLGQVCFYCGAPFVAGQPAVEWSGYDAGTETSAQIFFHKDCVMAFTVRVFRDVHALECEDRPTWRLVHPTAQ